MASQDPSIGSEGSKVTIASSKKDGESSSKNSSNSRRSRKSSRSSAIPRLPMFLNCPPNPPYTNYMDEEPSLKFYRKKTLSLEKKYDYSEIIKSSRIKCLTSLRYKTMQELEQEKSKWGIKERKTGNDDEEEECHETQFITIPATRYPSPQIASQQVDSESSAQDQFSTEISADAGSNSLSDENRQSGSQPPTQTQGFDDLEQDDSYGDDSCVDQSADQNDVTTGSCSTDCSKQSANQSQDCNSSANNNAGTEFVCCMCQQRFLCSKMDDNGGNDQPC